HPKRLIIIGAGGQGHIIHDVLSRDESLRDRIRLAGFLDTRPELVQPAELTGSVLGSPLDWKIQPDDLYIPAVGNPLWREKLLAPLIAQGARFFSYTHAAFIAARTRIGNGAFLTPGAVVSTDCHIGDFTYLDTFVVVGHDVTIGEYGMIGAMTFLSGGVRIGRGVAVHPRAVIARDVRIGDGATIGIGSVVVKDVSPGVTVFGNPARIINTA
ncbi:MAG: acetyltransferase, partial [Zoogloeaceae bacterium]|nr:acetyltransferase [Zoogloeaceae bacterium]